MPNNFTTTLNHKIRALAAPIVVGLDPVFAQIPDCYKKKFASQPFTLKTAAQIIFAFNKEIIDTVAPLVPAVKPQLAFYELFGSAGLHALAKTIHYAQKQNLLVIADAKRSDIGPTATAYAAAFLGQTNLHPSPPASAFNADALTIAPYLGADGLHPFIHLCHQNHKGLFILVKTSNPSSGDFQDVLDQNGHPLFTHIAQLVAQAAAAPLDQDGYSPIGDVVGATYPAQAQTLRALMPHSIFLVPGYGAQGAAAAHVRPCFNPDGLGALINSSRAIIYAYQTQHSPQTCTPTQYRHAVRHAVLTMRAELNNL